MDVEAVSCTTSDVVARASQHADDSTTACSDSKYIAPALPLLFTSSDKLALLQPAVTPLVHTGKQAQEDTTEPPVQQHELQPHEKASGTVYFGPITKQNVESLRQLNLAIFPVRYNDAFYTDILRASRAYAKFGASSCLAISCT